MLVLTRRKDERIAVGPNIEVVVLSIQGNRVRLGLVAPSEVPIHREEWKARADWAVAERLPDIAVYPQDTAGVLQ